MTVEHFSLGCTCTEEGEDPHCPHHGYEAHIANLNKLLDNQLESDELHIAQLGKANARCWELEGQVDDFKRALRNQYNRVNSLRRGSCGSDDVTVGDPWYRAQLVALRTLAEHLKIDLS